MSLKECQDKNIVTEEVFSQYSFAKDKYYICKKAKIIFPAPMYRNEALVSKSRIEKIATERQNAMCEGCIKHLSTSEQKTILTKQAEDKVNEIREKAQKEIKDVTEYFKNQISKLEDTECKK